jgi:gluconolactonase
MTTLADLLDPTEKPTQIATGFSFTEGPIWMADGSLHFSDIVGDARGSWHPKRGLWVKKPNNKGNGMTRDSRGNAIICVHATSTVIRETPAGDVEIIASHYQGKELNSPNDVIAASDDSIIFSDPSYGRLPGFGVERPLQLDFSGIFRVPAGGGAPELLCGDFGEPNGLCFSPDEKILYANDTPRAHIRAFDVGPNYKLSNSRIFAKDIGTGEIAGGVVDGMKIDEHGNVYVTGPKGIWVFDPGGAKIGVIPVPEHVGNMNWGDDDWRTLYVAASTSVYRLRMKVRGNQLPYMRK